MKKDQASDKPSVLLDTNNPWQVVLIVLITIMLVAVVRFGLHLIGTNYVYAGSESGSASSQKAQDLYNLMRYANIQTQKSPETENEYYGVTVIKTVQNANGIRVPIATHAPEYYAETRPYGYVGDI